jgi:hypothetical protein
VSRVATAAVGEAPSHRGGASSPVRRECDTFWLNVAQKRLAGARLGPYRASTVWVAYQYPNQNY